MQRTPARTVSPSSRRRRRAGLVLAAGLAVALSGCAKVTGFNVETDLPYVPAHGANYRVASVEAPVDVTGMVIVSGQDGSGTLIATFANNDPEAHPTPAIEGGDGVTITGYTSFELPANDFVNLALDSWADENEPIVVRSSDITPGAMIPVTVGEGDLAEGLWVPVVPDSETTSTLARTDEHHEEEGAEGGEGADGAEEEDHGTGDNIGEDDAVNPWAGLDRSAEPQAGRATVDPTADATDDATQG
ncbi:hypothetical protein RDV89_13840 [Nocardioides zeae]|uniref:DUF461 domain-containing protein n=1 Tax=Nocardioides imazamoxiresistens TaxID=3231893 RepID=A0ABU3PY38_9ACTN|nr:hypothetical protein [Nocardioides zeae]MDT9594160.1 hypothetical protein [Nocardioides zeae]